MYEWSNQAMQGNGSDCVRIFGRLLLMSMLRRLLDTLLAIAATRQRRSLPSTILAAQLVLQKCRFALTPKSAIQVVWHILKGGMLKKRIVGKALVVRL